MYESLGYRKESDVIIDNIQNNRLLFLKDMSSWQVLELIEPIDERSTVYNTNLQGYHHICYEVDDMGRHIEEFNAMGIGKLFTKTINAPAFNNRRIVFAYLKNRTIIEFLEAEKRP
jgi:hypothetical protein